MLNTMRDEQAIKVWRRALNGSRREVIKIMDAAGYRTTVWTKRDKGRTIMQVYIPDAAGLTLLQRVIGRVNRKWAAKMVYPVRGTQDAVCYSEHYTDKVLGTLYTLMHTNIDQITPEGKYKAFGE